MLENLGLVLGSNVLVVDGLSRLGIDPSDVGLSILESTIEVLDESHDPGHLDETLDGELSLRLHLPPGPGSSPRSDLSESSDDEDLVEIDHASEFVELLEGLDRLERREVELEVGSRSDGDLLVDSLGVDSVDDLEVGRVVDGDGSSKISGEGEVGSDLGGDLGEIRKSIHSSVEVGPDRLDLGDVEEERVHHCEKERVKGQKKFATRRTKKRGEKTHNQGC